MTSRTPHIAAIGAAAAGLLAISIPCGFLIWTAFAVLEGGVAATMASLLVAAAAAGFGAWLLALERARLSEKAAASQRHDESESFKSALLSSVSHDLRTPLASIIGAATTLQSLGDRLTPGDRAALAGGIAAEAARLNRYIQNLLDLTKLEHGAVRAAVGCIDLRDIVLAARSRLTDALAPLAVSQSISEEAAYVAADATLLEQILVNILDNAAKFAGPAGSVRIEAAARGRTVVLSVTDDGPGIAPGERDRIFEPFHTARRTALRNGREGAGAGLGLSIARGFARAIGGDVVAQAAPGGRGARLEVILPRAEQPALLLNEGGAAAPTVSNDAA